MPRSHTDHVSRVEDIENLLTTAQGLLSRFPDNELQVTKECLRGALAELRTSKIALFAKWKEKGRD